MYIFYSTMCKIITRNYTQHLNCEPDKLKEKRMKRQVAANCNIRNITKIVVLFI